jgi:hypothetical protein
MGSGRIESTTLMDKLSESVEERKAAFSQSESMALVDWLAWEGSVCASQQLSKSILRHLTHLLEHDRSCNSDQKHKASACDFRA